MSDHTTPPTGDETLGALVTQLSQQTSELVRSELRLAQAEMAVKGKRAGIGLGMFGGAGLLAFFGIAVLIAAAVLGLAEAVPGLALRADRGRGASRRRRSGCAGRQEERHRSGTGQAGASDRGHQGRHHDRQERQRPMSTDEPGTPEEIKADIEQQREHLADTVEALHDKLDVKAQAKAKVADVKARATTDTGSPRPEVIAGGVATVVGVVALIFWRRRR
ncbi:MAG: phage holin family protein [Marmoricola sp.]